MPLNLDDLRNIRDEGLWESPGEISLALEMLDIDPSAFAHWAVEQATIAKEVAQKTGRSELLTGAALFTAGFFMALHFCSETDD